MKYPKVQYELDLNAKYACRFFEKNGFAYEIKRQSYEGDTFELKKGWNYIQCQSSFKP